MLHYILATLDGYIIATSSNIISKLFKNINIYKYVQFISTINQLLCKQHSSVQTDSNSTNKPNKPSKPVSIQYHHLLSVVSIIYYKYDQTPLFISMISDRSDITDSINVSNTPNIPNISTASTRPSESNVARNINDEDCRCLTMINIMTHIITNYQLTSIYTDNTDTDPKPRYNLLYEANLLMSNITSILTEYAEHHSNIQAISNTNNTNTNRHGGRDKGKGRGGRGNALQVQMKDCNDICESQSESESESELEYIVGFGNETMDQLINVDLDALVNMFDPLNVS